MKQCKTCSETKDESEYYVSRKNYLKTSCKKCDNLKSVEWKNSHKDARNEHMKTYSIKKKYKLTRIEYLLLCKDGCAVCGIKEGLAVDHDHNCCSGQVTCGKCIRGVLCRRHNWAMSNLNDSAEEARLLAEYIESASMV